jgi:predicted nuclease of restriction endonuclease-like RecB superfamily
LSQGQPSSNADMSRWALRYLGPRDEPWLGALLDEHARHLGRKRVELRERLREPLAVRAPKNKLRLAIQVLERIVPDADEPRLSPRAVRARLFAAAAQELAPRVRVLAQVASELGVGVDELESSLLCDLAGERRLGAVPEQLSPAHLAVVVNHSLVSRLLKRAATVRIKASDQTGALVRHARLLGLICRVSRNASAHGSVLLEISGPFALFRKTHLYGRALASLLPRMASCRWFELEVRCVAGRGQLVSTSLVSSRDPIFPKRHVAAAERRLDQRFTRDFGRLASDWQVLAEPRPLEAPGALLFPDFELVHRCQSERRFLLEIMGFWTYQHVAEKLRQYRAAGIEHVILCIDERRRCSEAELPQLAHVLPYKNRIDAKQVLSVMQTWVVK